MLAQQGRRVIVVPFLEYHSTVLHYGHVDIRGKMSFRHAGKMRHLGIGVEHARKRVIAVADDHTVIVIHLDTGQVIASNDIQPDKAYWRNTQKAPRPMAGSFLVTHVATHV